MSALKPAISVKVLHVLAKFTVNGLQEAAIMDHFERLINAF